MIGQTSASSTSSLIMINYGFETEGMDKSGITPLDAKKLLRTIHGLNAALKSHLITIDPSTPLAEDNDSNVKKDMDSAQKPSIVGSPTKHIMLTGRVSVL